VGIGVGVGVGVGVDGGGVGAGAGARGVPDATGRLRAGTSVGAVGADSICPQATAATSAVTAKSPRAHMALIGGINMTLSRTPRSQKSL